MIERGIGDMYGNASYGKEQNVLHTTLTSQSSIRVVSSTRWVNPSSTTGIIYKNYPTINSRCVNVS